MARPKKVTESVRRISGPIVSEALHKQLSQIGEWFGLDSSHGLPISQLVMMIPNLVSSILWSSMICSYLCLFVGYLLGRLKDIEASVLGYKRLLQIERRIVKNLQKALERINPRQRTMKPWNRLSAGAKSRRRKIARNIFEKSKFQIDSLPSEMVKLLNQHDLIEFMEAASDRKLDRELKDLICEEIRQSIPLDKIVRLKDSGNISDKSYSTLVKLSPQLRKILPKPYHTVVQRRNLDKKLADFDPKETADGIDLDPELLFTHLVRKFDLHSRSVIECCISLDARPIKRRGKNEPQTVVGFKLGSQSPSDCFKQGSL